MLGKFKGEKRSLYSRLINENGGAGACLAVLAFWAAASFGLFSLIFALAQFAMFVSQVGGWDARGRGWGPGCG